VPLHCATRTRQMHAASAYSSTETPAARVGSCGSYDRGVDELDLAGLTRVPSEVVKPPRVDEAVLQMECKLRGTHDVKNKDGHVTCTIVIGEVGPRPWLSGCACGQRGWMTEQREFQWWLQTNESYIKWCARHGTLLRLLAERAGCKWV